MRIGSLDRRLEIVRDLETGRDAYNAPVLQPSTIAVVWASKRTLWGSEFLAGEAETVCENRLVLAIRYRSDLKTTDRLSCEGEEYEISALREIGRRRGIEIQATARQ